MEFIETPLDPIAIKIDTPRTAHILMTLDPTIGELDWHKDLHDHYIVFDAFNHGQYVIMTEKEFHNRYESANGEVSFFKALLVTEK